MNYSQAIQKLISIGQSHLLDYWGNLSDDEKKQLLDQINTLDVRIFLEQQNLLKNQETATTSLATIEPFTDFNLKGNVADREHGQSMIDQGLMGCLIVAGGQGTRLNFDGPKGLFTLTKFKSKSLFQLFAEKVLTAGKLAKRPLPLAIMTSPINHEITIQYFKDNDFFGLFPEQVHFFSQKTLPFLDLKGNLFLETPCTIAQGPNGNGEVLSQFFISGIWDHWYSKGIRFLNFVLIDNPLADPYDAELLGYQDRQKDQIAVKCTYKNYPEEKVGILALEKGKVRVVEYTELPESKRLATDSKGRLLYDCANLSLMCFSMDFIKKTATDPSISMPMHKALKKVRYLDYKGISIQSENPMAWKFEKYIFDTFSFASKINALIYPRKECFAPLKNFNGPDSILSVQQALEESDKRILSSITGQDLSNLSLEISQEFYYPTTQTKTKWHGKKIINDGYIEP